MRSRPIAALAAAFVLALSATACGGEDENTPEAVVPTSGDLVDQTSPIPSNDADPTETPAGSEGDSGSGGSGSGSGNSGSGTGSPQRTPSADLLPAVASKSSDLTNFSTAVGAAGLDATLEESGPYTVFAPNNDGFAKLGTRLDTLLQPASKADLANILSFHVIKGEVKAKDLKDGKLYTTVQGTRLRVTKKGDSITIGNSQGDAQIVSSDLIAGNGVIHVIDTVLTPKTK